MKKFLLLTHVVQRYVKLVDLDHLATTNLREHKLYILLGEALEERLDYTGQSFIVQSTFHHGRKFSSTERVLLDAQRCQFYTLFKRFG